MRGPSNELPVEKRLYRYSEMYNRHKEELKFQRRQEEQKEIRPPIISEESKRIAGAINVLFSIVVIT